APNTFDAHTVLARARNDREQAPIVARLEHVQPAHPRRVPVEQRLDRVQAEDAFVHAGQRLRRRAARWLALSRISRLRSRRRLRSPRPVCRSRPLSRVWPVSSRSTLRCSTSTSASTTETRSPSVKRLPERAPTIASPPTCSSK